MPRARNIKPQIMANEHLAEINPIGRLLFVYLWMLADKAGRLEDRPKRIRAQALPYDDADAGLLLNQLQDGGFIQRYRVGEQALIQILAFDKHQNPHVREQESELPGPDHAGAKHNLGDDEAQPRQCRAGLIPSTLIPDSLSLDSDSPTAHPVREEPQSRFADFWEVYPRKQGSKSKAEAKWKSRKLDRIADQIIADVRKRSEVEWLDRQYTPYPETYLNGSRWESDIEDKRPQAKRTAQDDIRIPEGTDVEAWSELGRIAMRAEMPKAEIERMRRMLIGDAKDLLRAYLRHPGGDAGNKGFRLIQGGVAA